MRNSWIKLADFNHKHGISRNHIHTVRNQKNPHWIIRTKEEGKTALITVNDGFLLRVDEFRDNITNEARELYYELTDVDFTQYSLSRKLSKNSKFSADSWNTYMQTALFQTLDDKMTILFVTIRPMTIEFVRKCRRLKAR